MPSKNIKYRTKKIGLPAGSLVSLDEATTKISISLIDYDAEIFVERNNIALQECLAYLDTPSNTWINICGIHDPKTVAAIGGHFGLHPLVLEDIMSTGQRSKLDNYKDIIYIVVRMLTYNDAKQTVEDEQVSLILGTNFIISFLESQNDIFSPIRERMRSPKSRLRLRGTDYLCYALIDCLVDSYFLILEKVDEKLENLEDALINNPIPQTLQKIQQSKREITLLRKSVWPMREVISNFRRMESPLIQDATKLYIQDVYDHTIQAIDTIESFRDITSGMIDIYLSNISQRMNEVMKVLTVVATIFVPLTFISSFYGMNLEMPEMHMKWTYPILVAVMLCISITMICYFRRKRWL